MANAAAWIRMPARDPRSRARSPVTGARRRSNTPAMKPNHPARTPNLPTSDSVPASSVTLPVPTRIQNVSDLGDKAFSAHLEHGLDFDGNVIRQRTHPDRHAGVAPGFSEHFHEQVGGAGDDLGIGGKCRPRVHEHS